MSWVVVVLMAFLVGAQVEPWLFWVLVAVDLVKLLRCGCVSMKEMFFPVLMQVLVGSMVVCASG